MASRVCLSEERLAAFASGVLAPSARAEVDEHLRECAGCFAMAARVMSPSTESPPVQADAVADTVAAGSGGGEEPASPFSRGSVLGRYVILGRIGAGGMGVVYAAYDAELDRKLAIKLLQSDGATTFGTEGRARLQREAQAMARISHENIIAVFDVGSVGHHVFVAMEFIDGVTLAQWLVGRAPSWRETLALFLGAGRGLAAAHAASIVHRDFKPDNVMVGKDGRLRVLDFGLARAADDGVPGTGEALPRPGAGLVTRLTRSGSLLGTPRYMSPEQWRREAADARSDQFSFCVALYEALYGELPFEGTTVAALSNAVLEGRVRKAPAGRDVPAWLEQIVRRGLSVDPSARFPSMDDLVSALASDPDVARGRRRRVQLVGGAFALLAAVAGFGFLRSPRAPCHGLESRLVGVWDPPKRSAVRAAFAASVKPAGADTADRVVRLLDRYADSWLGTRVEACEATRVRGDQSEHLLDLRVACLDRRLRELSSLTDVLTAAPDGETINKAVNAATQLPSVEGCSDAAALQATVAPPGDAAQRRRVEELRTQLASARTLENTGKYDRALAIARDVDAAAEKTSYAPLRAEALSRRGSLEERTGDSKGAEQRFNAALSLAAEGHDDVLAARIWPQLLVAVGQDQARYADAVLLTPVAEAAIRRAGDDEARAALGDVEGRLFAAQGKFADAQRMFEASLVLRQRTLPPEDPAIATSLNNLGIAYDEQGKYGAALEAYRRALAIRERTFGPRHPIVSGTVGNIGIVLKEQGNYDEAQRMFERAVSIDEEALGPENPALARSLNSLGNCLSRQRKYAEAQRAHERALAIREKVLGPEHPDVAISLHNLGETLAAEGKYDEAQEKYERALAIRQKALDPDNPLVGSTMANLGDLLAKQSHFAEAAVQYERALSIFEKSEGSMHPDLAFPLTGLAVANEGMGRHHEAVAAAERALRIREAASAAPEDVGHTRFVLAQVLWGAGGDRTRARSLARQALTELAPTGGPEARAEVERWLAAHAA